MSSLDSLVSEFFSRLVVKPDLPRNYDVLYENYQNADALLTRMLEQDKTSVLEAHRPRILMSLTYLQMSLISSAHIIRPLSAQSNDPYWNKMEELAHLSSTHLRERVKKIEVRLQSATLEPQTQSDICQTIMKLRLPESHTSLHELADQVLHDTLKPIGMKAYHINHTPYATLTCESRDLPKFVKFCRESSRIPDARKAHSYTMPAAPTDCEESLSQLLSSWNLDMIQAPTAWLKTKGEGATIAIIDTGIDYTHPELRHAFGAVKGFNFILNSDDPFDDEGHGTHCAGIAAGKSIGVAPAAHLLAVKVLDQYGMGMEGDIARGLAYAIDQGVNVASMSLGGTDYSEAMAHLCAVANKKGITVCAAAGNDGISQYNYPASYPHVLSIAAVNRYKKIANFSQHNDLVDLCAPGVNILSSVPGKQYEVMSGTSMATPHVAGVAALLASAKKQGIADLLIQNGEKIEPKDYYGQGGLVQADNAMRRQKYG